MESPKDERESRRTGGDTSQKDEEGEGDAVSEKRIQYALRYAGVDMSSRSVVASGRRRGGGLFVVLGPTREWRKCNTRSSHQPLWISCSRLVSSRLVCDQDAAAPMRTSELLMRCYRCGRGGTLFGAKGGRQSERQPDRERERRESESGVSTCRDGLWTMA